MAELLRELSETHGVSGNEDCVRRLIVREIKDKTDSITVDTMGNIIAFKKGKTGGKTVAVTANMDETGLIISGITEKGYLKFKPVGDIDPRKLVSKRVVTQGGVKGVIGMKAIHLQTREEREAVVKVKNLFIDIGAKDKDEAEKRVSIGDYVTFDTEFARIGSNVKGKALTRSGACYALCKALEYDYPHNFYAVFTAQREVGARGAYIAAHRLNADTVLTVSAADTADMYDVKGGGMKLGKGVTLSYYDKSVIADRQLTDKILDISRKKGIIIQTRVTRPHNSEGGALELTGARVVNAVIPCRYANSPVSLMNTGDIDETVKLIRLFLKEGIVE